VTIRLSHGEPIVTLIRVLAAGVATGAPLTVSSAVQLPTSVLAVLTELGISSSVEGEGEWLAHAVRLGAGRIRLIGGDPQALAVATDGRPDLAIYSNPVTPSGRLECLPFLHEQAVSITAHRFGTPNNLTDHLI
jgi:RHH-type proline utilization regulon transcriptional repressor/proline dehydrogenase/delta 1-pyrroline-5-carboxylate dehydrogenase